MADRHEAIRTCIGCRARAARGELVRLVLTHDVDGSQLVARDDAGRMPGRGAWIHPAERCRQLAIQRRALRRALRVAGDIEDAIPSLDDITDNDGDGHVTQPGATPTGSGS